MRAPPLEPFPGTFEADAARLLLARGERRQRELAIGMAVGTSRGHVIRQLLIEILLLSGLGALMGETIASLRAAVARVDSELPLFRVRTLADQIHASIARERLLAWLFAAFGGLALALSWAGLYGLVSFVTAARTREIGVRMALGAGAGDVFRLVAGQSLRLSALGLAIGSLRPSPGHGCLRICSTASGRSTFPRSPSWRAWRCGPAAGHLPARRALRIEPSAALRHD